MKKTLVFVLCLVVLAGTMVSAKSITYQMLADNVAENFANVQDASAKLNFKVVEEGISTEAVVLISGSLPLELVRIEMLAPAVMAGQVIVMDQNAGKLKMYMPAMAQIIVQDLQAGNALMGFDVSGFDSTFDFHQLNGEILETITTETGVNYVVAVEVENQVQKIWIDQDFMPIKIEAYQGDKLISTISLLELKLDSGLTAEQLQSLPNVPEVIF